jgi:type VI secretion system secreted protein VgrG
MAHTQDTRLCRIDSPLGANQLLVARLSATESVSRLFQIELDLLSPGRDHGPDDLLGQSVSISLELNNGRKRFFHGFVSRWTQGDVEGELFSYRMEVVPWLWFLSRNVDCRIFQDKTVPQILETIFKDHGFQGFFELKTPTLTEPKEYCVQYRESDLHFVSRLMEEEGLFYFFKHSQDKHVLVVTDGTEDQPNVSAPTSVSMRPGDPQGREVERWFAERELHSGVFANAEFNPDDRSLIASMKLTTRQIANNQNLEVFDYPSEQMTIGASDERAAMRMQAEESTAARHSGIGRMPGFSAGHLFTLTDHFNARLNDEYMLTSVHHGVTQELARGGSSSYFNSFSAVRSATSFRPPLVTPKPIVQGPQTAIVVGKQDPGKIDPEPADDDIDVDELGRVLVKFHWDRSGPARATRESKSEHQTSCRVRVSQFWAGKNWGAAFWPRIGQEVIVEFIEGDPDHPIITGRVYNGKFKPPYALPANKTQSGVKSRSTPDGAPSNFNEIRFEDKKGHEEFFMQAERSMNIKVKGSESHSVGGSQSLTVNKNQTVTVKEGDRKVVVEKGNDSHTIKVGDRNVDILTGNDVLFVQTGNIESSAPAGTHKMDAMNVEMIGTAGIKISCGASMIELTPGSMKLECGGSKIELNPGITTITAPLVKINC